MNIAIYKNISDREIKKLCEIADEIYRSCGNIDLISTRDVSRARKKINIYNTVLFITHGDKTTLYHNLRDSVALISSLDDTINFLNNKKIIALSCSTGSILGEEACKRECIVYFGLKHKLHFNIIVDNEEVETSLNYKNFILDVYKKAFKNGLTSGIEKNVTFDQLETILQIELSRTILEENERFKQKNRREYSLNKFEYSINAVFHVSDSFVIHGDRNQTITEN